MTDRIPAEVFPPGDFLRDELQAREWTQLEFAEIIGRPARLVNEIIAGKRGITPETAKEFSAALGTSPHYWLNLESSYQLSKTMPASEVIARAAALRDKFPVREMIKRGWIEASENVEVLETRILRFFQLSSIEDEIVFSHAARRSEANRMSQIQWAWVFRVRQLANALSVQNFSKKNLRLALTELEARLTDPEEARHVSKILANAGVRFLVVEPVPGSKIEGVCFWIDDQNPVIGLTMRFDRIDNFWFNLRHELEHVLNEDGKAGIIIDEPDDLSESHELPLSEQLANEAAAEFCVPQAEIDDFIDRLDPIFSTERLIGFSRIVERHPGIVAGQLQKKTGRWDLFKKFQVKIRHAVTATALTDGYGYSTPIEV
ncbi:MAG: helix-turn-helix domain-containing protein [Rhodospirillaceae bacterium]|nr:helix-turn-helix domain-containing protein [Rhodospirillaceae bacterium]MYI51019.1 helix-turn-helix domain-containing protein [Rhodospirillaceae bacterium]